MSDRRIIERAAELHGEAIRTIRGIKERQGAGDDAADFRQAYETELTAIELLRTSAAEPLKSDVYTMAALAALGMGEWQEAERLALEGQTPDAPVRAISELQALAAAARERRDLVGRARDEGGQAPSATAR
jgi:hypothetical protein